MGKLNEFYSSANWRELFNVLLPGISYDLKVFAGKISITAKISDQEKILTH